MKKGDLIKLKEGHEWEHDEALAMGFKSVSDIPEFLEVESVELVMYCCTPRVMVSVVGVKEFVLKAENFEVALEAGVPDVEKLLEEARQLEYASIGF